MRRPAACLSLLTVALAALPGTAAADGSDPAFPHSRLAVTVTGPEQAGRVLTIHATGANVARTQGLRTLDYGLELIVTDPAILPGACASTEQAQLARIAAVRGGGSLLTYDDLPEGLAGPFSLREPYEPVGSGPLRVCAYSEWDHQDAAWAQADARIAPAPRPPRARARPQLHRAGRLLLCSRGRWSGSPTRFTYRWRVGDGRYGPARRGARYAITARDRGRSIGCEVLARGPGGTGSATSPGFRIA